MRIKMKEMYPIYNLGLVFYEDDQKPRLRIIELPEESFEEPTFKEKVVARVEAPIGEMIPIEDTEEVTITLDAETADIVYNILERNGIYPQEAEEAITEFLLVKDNRKAIEKCFKMMVDDYNSKYGNGNMDVATTDYSEGEGK